LKGEIRNGKEEEEKKFGRKVCIKKIGVNLLSQALHFVSVTHPTSPYQKILPRYHLLA